MKRQHHVHGLDRGGRTLCQRTTGNVTRARQAVTCNACRQIILGVESIHRRRQELREALMEVMP